MIDSALRAWAQAVLERPRTCAAGIVLVTLGALALLPRLRIDPDVASLLPEGNQTAELLEVTELGSQSSRTLLLLVRGDRLEERLPELIASLSASPHLAAVSGTRESFAGERVDVYCQAPLWFLPEPALQALEARLGADGRRAALRDSLELLSSDPLAGREVVLRDPLGLREIYAGALADALPRGFAADTPYLLLEQRTLALIRVLGQRDAWDVEYAKLVLADVEERARGFELRLLGGYATARSIASEMRRDLMISTFTSVPLVIGFLVLSMGEIWMAHLLVLPACLAILWALGYGGALLGPLTPLAVSAAAILTGLGVDYPIYYLRRYRAERERATHEVSIERAHRSVGRGILAGMTTTAAAFLCFGLGHFGGLQSFGWLLALGLCLAFAATLGLFPLLLRRESLRARPERESWIAGRFARVARSRAGAAVASGLVLAGVAGWIGVGARGLSFDTDPRHLHAGDEPLRQLVAELEGELGFAPLPVLALVPIETPLAQVAQAVGELRRAHEIGFAGGPQEYAGSARRAELVAEFRKRHSGWVEAALVDLEREGFAPTPFRSGLAEQAAALLGDPPPTPASEQPLSWRGRSWWKVALHPTHTLVQRSEREAFHARVREVLGAQTPIADAGALADELGPLLKHDLQNALWICAALVAALTIGLVRSLWAGLLALVPVLCALGIVLGTLSALGWPIHPGNFVALPLILGTGVNAGIMIVLAAREGIRDPVAATGTAVWRAAFTTVLGFGSLVTATSPALSSLGAIVLAGVLLCFGATLLILPILLRLR